ncbi:MAG: pyrimidine dimer DNA glycosylase/endonuclease V [Gammaproteobacteria bacterium]
MRLWSLHPRYLDRQGLLALWRESLLARAVLHGRTKDYRLHPQLQRFSAHPHPQAAISAYLAAVHAEAIARGYTFDASKIDPADAVEPIPVSEGQLALERAHLLAKLAARSPEHYHRWRSEPVLDCHPLFVCCPGPVEAWERSGTRGSHAR